MKRVLITGVSGQDGSYLARRLLADGDRVFGVARHGSNLSRLSDLPVVVYRGDVSKRGVEAVLSEVQPEEVYHLASIVADRNADPGDVVESTATATMRLLEAVRVHCPKARVFIALSAEMFDDASPYAKNEVSPLCPKNPYGCGKLLAYYAAKCYRDSHGLHVSTGILFPHDSEVRDPKYLTRKVTKAVAEIRAGKRKELGLGDLSARRDRGHAEDYAAAMPLILRHVVPDDFVVATGEAHSSFEFVQEAFARAGLHWRNHVVADGGDRPKKMGEVLLGDATKIRSVLGWAPKINFTQMVHRMVDSDLRQEGVL